MDWRPCRSSRGTGRGSLRSSVLLAALIFAAGASAPPAPAQEKPDACVACHRKLEENRLSEPVSRMENDVHRDAGLSCADCHGGNPDAPAAGDPYVTAKDRAKGYSGKIDRKGVAPLCARCHGDLEVMRKFNPRSRVDQYMEYRTSVHGKRVEAGDTKAATCTSCHGAHGILKVKDPAAPVYPTHVPGTCARCHSDPAIMKEYGIPVDQYEKYARSLHGIRLLKEKDSSAPACNTCHGNHGAVPPGLASIAHVCGNCHATQAEDFAKSNHAEHFARQDLPLCSTCHGHHEIPSPGDHLLAHTEASTCNQCHAKDDPCYRATGRMLEALQSFARAREETAALLDRGERLGMNVAQAKFELEGSKDSLTQARIRIHRFKEEEVSSALKPGREAVDRARRAGLDAIEEHDFRRKGLSVSAAIILATVFLLLAKIRRLKGERADTNTKG